MSKRPTWVRIALVVLAVLAGVVAGLAALIGAASVTTQVPFILLSGLVAFCAVYLLALALVARTDTSARYFALLSIGSACLVVAVVAATVLPTLPDPRLPPAPVAGQQFWVLDTGSRIAFVHIAAVPPVRPTPLIFLHGGPGVPDLAGDSRYFGALARDGFEVYVYAQVGRGRSTRLDDPRDYTLERDVADLEAIRQRIGAEEVVLAGHSSGGMLAAAYAAAHPARVAKLVLISPADPAPGAGGASMTGRLRLDQQFGVYALLLQPRALLGYALLQVNPLAAHAFAGDAEMDARFDRIYNRTRPALHCEGKPPGPKLHGLGFYAHYYPQSAARVPHGDFLPALASQRIPALILKGRCDYLSWSSAVLYQEALAEARVIYFEGSGHNIYQDEPERTLAVLQAFILDQPLPEPPFMDHHAPADYEGPA